MGGGGDKFVFEGGGGEIMSCCAHYNWKIIICRHRITGWRAIGGKGSLNLLKSKNRGKLIEQRP